MSDNREDDELNFSELIGNLLTSHNEDDNIDKSQQDSKQQEDDNNE